MITTHFIHRVKPCMTSSFATRWKSTTTTSKSDLLKKANIALARQSGQTSQKTSNNENSNSSSNEIAGPFENQQVKMKGPPSSDDKAKSNSSTPSTTESVTERPLSSQPVDLLQQTTVNNSTIDNGDEKKSSFDRYRVPPMAQNVHKGNHVYQQHYPVDKREASITAMEPTNPSFSRMQFHQGHLHEFAPRIVVVGVGGGGGNAVNNMIANQLRGE